MLIRYILSTGSIVSICLLLFPACDDSDEGGDGSDTDADTDSDTDTDSDGDIPDPDPAAPFVVMELFTSES